MLGVRLIVRNVPDNGFVNSFIMRTAGLKLEYVCPKYTPSGMLTLLMPTLAAIASVACAAAHASAQTQLTREQQKSLNWQLLKAASDGDESRVRSLVARGASVRAVGGKALWYSCETEPLTPEPEDHPHPVSLVKFLISKGANVNFVGDDGRTPLMVAANVDGVDAARLLLEHGANANATDPDGKTALMIAARTASWEDGDICFPEMARVLLSHGARANAADKAGDTSLLLVASLQYADTNLGSDGSPEDADTVKFAQQLLQHGANVDSRDASGETALLLAANTDGEPQPRLIHLLLQSGAKTNVMDKNGDTPLILIAGVDDFLAGATYQYPVSIARDMIAHGAAVNTKNQKGRTALMMAANSHGYMGPFCKVRLGHLLIDQGAWTNDVDNNGDTALIWLAGVTNNDPINASDVEFAKDLVKHGADISIKNHASKTALDIARTNYLKRLIRFLATQKEDEKPGGASKAR